MFVMPDSPRVILRVKSIGLKITYYESKPKFYKKRSRRVTVRYGLTDISFEKEVFEKFCKLLRKTKSKQELQKEIKKNPYIEDTEVHSYGGIRCTNKSIDIMCGGGQKNAFTQNKLNQIKRTYLDDYFTLFFEEESEIKFYKKMKRVKMIKRSCLPEVFIYLNRTTFLKFRDACLRAVVKINNLRSVVKLNKDGIRVTYLLPKT
ncbi:MAG: hypothetical protein A2987_05050 [Omnitrophica bacterium RIFCSPLOWO2_01_FULL_45_10]|nr:MAG: hypothetical protein A2987_05050 [Omnitrophica bacterium RIFCSPLOWO2_01_FULL_45_10]